MTYKINNSPLLLQPSEGNWEDRKDLGIDGNDKIIYVPTYMFVLKWDIMSFTEFKQIYDAWKGVQTSGTLSADLPSYGGDSYDTFTVYTEVNPEEPRFKRFFQKHYLDVEWTLRTIVVT